MGKYRIICSKCGHVVKDEPAYKCPACGGILEFKYDVPKQFGERTAGAHGVFKYLDVLPVSGDMPVTLGEGGTPLVESVRLAEEFGLDRLFFKLEFVNPTGSFKDRGMAVLFTKAAELGMKKAVVASSGNAAASAAAYAARSGVELVAVVPENTPEGKTVQMETHGGKVLKVPGLFGNSYTLCKGLAEKNGWFNLTTTFLNPYAREGYKTASYEIFEQLGHATPDIVVVPTSDGPLLASVYEAFDELVEHGLSKKIPKLVSVQAFNCDPINESWRTGMPCEKTTKKWVETIASGIDDNLDGYEEDGDHAVDLIRKSGGTAISLTEEEVRDSVLELARDGVYAEPAGAVSAMALRKLREGGFMKEDDIVVCVVTGSGLKNPLKIERRAIPVVSTVDEAVVAVRRWDDGS